MLYCSLDLHLHCAWEAGRGLHAKAKCNPNMLCCLEPFLLSVDSGVFNATAWIYPLTTVLLARANATCTNIHRDDVFDTFRATTQTRRC